MDQEIQALQKELTAIREIVEADHKMIQGIYSRVRFSTAINIIKLVIIVGFSLGAFYFIQPLLENVIKTYTDIGGLGSGGGNESSYDLLKAMIQ